MSKIRLMRSCDAEIWTNSKIKYKLQGFFFLLYNKVIAVMFQWWKTLNVFIKLKCKIKITLQILDGASYKK